MVSEKLQVKEKKLLSRRNDICAQEWLNRNYPIETREKIKKLVISEKGLKGELSLGGFTNLEYLDCSGNGITKLDISTCLHLNTLCSFNNQITSTDYLVNLPNKEKLTFLSYNINRYVSQDLSFLREFTNLEVLYSGGESFYGSLEPLKNMTKLRDFDIQDTYIDSGLEYLPDSLEKIWCSGELAIQLGSYVKNDSK